MNVAPDQVALNALCSGLRVNPFGLWDGTLTKVLGRDWATECLAEIEAIKTRASGLPVLFVAGMFSAGKSSVVNALLGETFIPAKPQPTTAVITQFRYGKNRRATLHYHDGRVPAGVELSTWQHLTDQAYRDAHPEENLDALAEGLDRVEVEHPAPLLRLVTLVDAPGFGSAYDASAHDIQTYEHLPEADLLLWVTNACTCGNDEEVKSLNRVVKELGGLPPARALLNVAEELPPSSREDRVQAFLDAAGGVFKENTVRPYSAKTHLDLLAARGQDESDPLVANWAADLEAFIKVCGPDALARRRRRAVQKIQGRVLETLEERCRRLGEVGTQLQRARTHFNNTLLEVCTKAGDARRVEAVQQLERLAREAAAFVKDNVRQHKWRGLDFWYERTTYSYDHTAVAGFSEASPHAVREVANTFHDLDQVLAREVRLWIEGPKGRALTEALEREMSDASSETEGVTTRANRVLDDLKKKHQHQITLVGDHLVNRMRGNLFGLIHAAYGEQLSARLQEVYRDSTDAMAQRLLNVDPEVRSRKFWAGAFFGTPKAPAQAALKDLADVLFTPLLTRVTDAIADVNESRGAVAPLLN